MATNHIFYLIKSTNIERRLVHDEKSNSFINFPRIPYGDPRNLVGFFFLKYVFKPEKTLKGPSQPVCIAAVCYCYYPGDLISFTAQMVRFVRIFRRGYVLHVIFRLSSKRKLPGRLTWHLNLNQIVAYKTTEPLDCQNCQRSEL